MKGIVLLKKKKKNVNEIANYKMNDQSAGGHNVPFEKAFDRELHLQHLLTLAGEWFYGLLMYACMQAAVIS
jgi:hypothetical protein